MINKQGTVSPRKAMGGQFPGGRGNRGHGVEKNTLNTPTGGEKTLREAKVRANLAKTKEI